jgi:hypothetical protein
MSPGSSLRVNRHARLRADPLDQFVEQDRLLGRKEAAGVRKSIFAGGFSMPSVGNGNAGHWRFSASAGIGWGGVGLLAQAPSITADRSNAA